MTGQSSDNIPVLRPDLPLEGRGKLQPQADETTRRLYGDVKPDLVKIETERARGSGFFVDENGRVVTDAHCVQDAREVQVRTAGGDFYRARIEKLDDINDLAVLRLEDGKTPAGEKPVSLGASRQLRPDQPVYALGNPLGLDQVYISPGYFRRRETLGQLITADGGKDEITLEKTLEQMTPLERREAQQVLNRTLIHGRVHIEPGNSGGPLIDAQGNVVGVSDLLNSQDHSLAYFTPVEKVRDLLNQTDPRFSFSYTRMGADWAEDYKNLWRQEPLAAGLYTGLAGGAGGLLVSRLPRLASAAMVYYGATHLASDYDHWRGSHNSTDSWKFGLSSVSDLAITAGGVAGLFAGTRTTGLAVMGAGLLARLGTDFIPNRLVLTDIRRTARNDYRPPESLDHLLGSSQPTGDALKRLNTGH